MLTTIPLVSLILISSSTLSSSELSSPCETVTAIFTFGDSTVDPGNNNFLPTAFRSDFPPYGRDFLDHIPTGRFTNGKLTTDFVASYLGLKDHLPPYLDLTLAPEELATGVSFASAGSGFDLLTAQLSGVIPVPLQIKLFKTYLTRVTLLLGLEKTKEVITKAIFVVSAGTNDFIANYFTLPVRKKEFTIEEYHIFLLNNIDYFLQELQDLGAKKIVVAGLPPMGCLPVVITLNWKGPFQSRDCIEYYNSLAKDFNLKLKQQLQNTSHKGGANIYYLDTYNPLFNIISSPTKFGMVETRSGCCGTGLVETALLCNLKSVVCPDPSKYVFWDSIHPTQKTYNIMFEDLRPLLRRVCSS